MLASQIHNAGAAVFLLFTVAVPFLYMVIGAVSGHFDGGEKKSRRPREFPMHQAGEARERNRSRS